MAVRCLIIACLLFGCCTSRSLAYNATGHKVIASICFRQLNSSQRTAVIELLKKHPRFQADFLDAMPSNLSSANDETKSEWLFQQAAIWPDIVRSGPPARTAFHRSRWHYVNVPVFMTDEDEDALEDQIDVNLATHPGTQFDDTSMNVIQAINNSIRILRGTGHTDPQKAVHFCWLLHLIGDIHQPLHSTALFSRNLFSQGDQGGNRVKTQPLKNLHSAWDSAIGTSSSFANCRNLAIQLLDGSDAPSQISAALVALDPVQWRNELVAVAKEHAYSHEIIVQLQALEENDDDINHNPIQLSDDYLRSRRDVASVLVVRAGARAAMQLVDLNSPLPQAAWNRLHATNLPVAEAANNAIAEEIRNMNEKLDLILELLEDLQIANQ